MKFIKLSKYYSVDRDDSEIRLVICPKCGKSNITKTDQMIAFSYNNYPLKLCKCNACNTWFTFYREDGMREISKEEAKVAEKGKHFDIQEDGKDNHGHCYYVAFSDKPKTISPKEYEEKVTNSDYDSSKRWKNNNLIDLGIIAKNNDLITKIIWDEK